MIYARWRTLLRGRSCCRYLRNPGKDRDEAKHCFETQPAKLMFENEEYGKVAERCRNVLSTNSFDRNGCSTCGKKAMDNASTCVKTIE